MAVVIDELVGEVEPERAPATEAQQNQSEQKEPEPTVLDQSLRRMERRAERLRAD